MGKIVIRDKSVNLEESVVILVVQAGRIVVDDCIVVDSLQIVVMEIAQLVVDTVRNIRPTAYQIPELEMGYMKLELTIKFVKPKEFRGGLEIRYSYILIDLLVQISMV